MKVWTNNKFQGRYPVGAAAVVVAPDREMAVRLLSDALLLRGIEAVVRAEDFEELPTRAPRCVVLCDGDY